MSVLLTFIVPCYNVERYVQNCLDSIYGCNLPEKQFEVLCVNDCSPDNVQEILERNQERYENLRIIVHEQNKGLGGARNTGIREARGQYLWFVDSDDMVTTKGLMALIKKTIDENLDVLCFNYCRVNEEGKELSIHPVFNNTLAQDGYTFVKSVFGKGIVNHIGYVWRFIYRTDYLRQQQLFFPENVRWEDTVYMPKALLKAGLVDSVSDILYSYRVNANSISGTFGSVYPAGSIYEFAFCAGGDLLIFSEEIKDEELRTAFRDMAVQKYINGFAIHLLRTGKQERKRFYKMVKDRRTEVQSLKQYMSFQNKVMLMPGVGPLITDLMSRVYKLKHGKRG